MGVWAERSVFDLVIGCFGLARESVCPTGGGGWRRQTKATHAKRQRVARKTGRFAPIRAPRIARGGGRLPLFRVPSWCRVSGRHIG